MSRTRHRKMRLQAAESERKNTGGNVKAGLASTHRDRKHDYCRRDWKAGRYD